MNNSVKLLSSPVNFAVVQLPERQYPGVVVQGDTLLGFIQRLNRMRDLLASGNDEALLTEIEDLQEILSDALSFYEKTCQDHSIG